MKKESLFRSERSVGSSFKSNDLNRVSASKRISRSTSAPTIKGYSPKQNTGSIHNVKFVPTLLRQPRKKDLLSSFQGTGLDITWDKDKEDEKSKLHIIEGEDDEDTDEIEEVYVSEELDDPVIDSYRMDPNSSTEIAKSATGDGIKDKNVFILEVVGNRFLRLAIAIIYISFFSLVAIEHTYFRSTQSTIFPMPIINYNATEDKVACDTQFGLFCFSDSNLNVDRAKLLANTVVVDDGINVTNWECNGAKKDSPPFNSHNVSGLFMAEPAILEYSANCDLQPFWDEITAVIWAGDSGACKPCKYRSFSMRIQFEKLDGEWPANIADGAFPVFIDSYSCVRGGENFCDSVGNWRKIIQTNTTQKPPKDLNGNIFTVTVLRYTYYLELIEVFEREAWRIVLRGDPAGAVTDCLKGLNCRASLVIEGLPPNKSNEAWALLVCFILYSLFFICWVFLLRKRRGRNCSIWPRENIWHLGTGVGFLFQLNIFWTGLTRSLLYNNSFAFSQGAWAAAVTITHFGFVIVIFTFFCFVDAPKKYVTTNFQFCRYKILIAFMAFVATTVTVFYHFPQTSGQDEPGTDTHLGGIGYGTSPFSWYENDQNVLVCAQSIMLVIMLFVASYYCWKFYVGFRLLDTLPYGMTRPIQLSFRFFFWATGLWIFALVSITIHDFVLLFQYANGIFPGNNFKNVLMASDTAATLHHSHSTPHTIFMFVIIIVLQTFFLPPSLEMMRLRSKKYHVTIMDELNHRISRRSGAKNMMVLEKALLLCTCSKEAYLPFNDEELSQRIKLRKSKPEKRNSTKIDLQQLELAEEGSAEKMKSVDKSVHEICELNDSHHEASGSFNLENKQADEVNQIRIAGEMCDKTTPGAHTSTWASGCRVVSRIGERGGIDIHDTRVIIFRHDISNDLIVAFRGTATVKQAKTDLMMSQVNVCLDTFLMIPTRKGKIKINAKRDGVAASRMENKLISGEINKVRLLDLIPKTTDELPSYLRDAEKAADKISGKGRIHFGFWSSYNRVRRELHETIREELVARPGRLILTGHSLGGSQATLCAYDMCRWVLPTVKHRIQYRGGNREILGKIKL